jgi:hypothetical protein
MLEISSEGMGRRMLSDGGGFVKARFHDLWRGSLR